MRLLFLGFAVALAVAPFCTLSAESPPQSRIKSSYGFEVQLPQGWVMLGPREASRKATALSPADFGLAKVSQKVLGEYLERAKTETIEFYLDALLSTEEFTNNISVQLEQGSQDYSHYSTADVGAFCEQLGPSLEKVWSTPINTKGCDVVPSNGSAVLAFSYVIPARNMFVIQYEIPYDSTHTMVVVGSGRLGKDVAARVQSTTKAIATSITGRANERPGT